MEVRVEEDGESQRRSVMGRIGVEPARNITPRESVPTSIGSFLTRKPVLLTQETKQMTAVATPTGAVSHTPTDWNATHWHKVTRNVRWLQARIVKATQAGRFNKVKVLQRLLTHSFSARTLAVKRVTTNEGKKAAVVLVERAARIMSDLPGEDQQTERMANSSSGLAI